MIAILDYGLGDTQSISKAFEDLGHPYVITAEPMQIKQADGIVLPGTGVFGDGMKALAETGLDRLLKEEVYAGKPILGIALGMHLLFTSGDEQGYHQGLNLLPGHVRKLDVDGALPHARWSWLQFKHPHRLYRDLEEGYVYFSHSYYVDTANDDDVIGTTVYHKMFPAIVVRGNIVGMQFRPEESGELGLRLLDQFVTQIIQPSTLYTD